MSNLAYKLEETYTYADYLSWEGESRYEIIDGIVYAMSAPSDQHQAISMELSGIIWSFLKGKPCRVRTAPFDVRLFPKEDNSDTIVVQPDIVVICDSSKLSDGKACKGAPDLVIEILSPNSVIFDRNVKAEKYRAAGVKEYWIVDTDSLNIMVNKLAGNHFVSTIYKDVVVSSVLHGLSIDLNAVRASIPY